MAPPPDPAPALLSRMRARPVLKIATWLGLAVGICVPYFALQHVRLVPARALPLLPPDAWVGFDPGWIWAYVSLALLVPLAPLMAASREELQRYAKGLAWVCLPCFAAFLLVPLDGPRPEAAPDGGLYAAIISLDRPSNSMPSLHAALTAWSLLYLWRILAPGLGAAERRLYVAGALLWCGLILYSTLATKQHGVLDLPAGVAIAFAAHALVWRDAGPVRAAAGSSWRIARETPSGGL